MVDDIHGSSGPEIPGFGPEMGVFGHIFKFQSRSVPLINDFSSTGLVPIL